MSRWHLLTLLFLVGMIFAGPAAAVGDGLASHRIVSEDVSEHRRLVNVRIERRLREAEIARIGEDIRQRQSRPFARTVVNFFLPGQDLQQGAWGSVAFTTESKVVINGLRQEDEEVLVAEFAADKRPLLGSWLTSPPAAPGRFTIFSSEGRIYGEWRLRNGQRTVDELIDVSSRNERRFEVLGGSTYVLTRSGDLEIREKTALVAVAERIRPGRPALPGAMALGGSSSPAVMAPVQQPLAKAAAPALASPVQPEPVQPARSAAAPAAESKLAPVEALAPAASDAAHKAKAKSHTVAKTKEPATRSAKSGETTPGDQISAKLGRI